MQIGLIWLELKPRIECIHSLALKNVKIFGCRGHFDGYYEYIHSRQWMCKIDPKWIFEKHDFLHMISKYPWHVDKELDTVLTRLLQRLYPKMKKFPWLNVFSYIVQA